MTGDASKCSGSDRAKTLPELRLAVELAQAAYLEALVAARLAVGVGAPAESRPAALPAAHPSRTAPKCQDCMHKSVRGDSYMAFTMCNHPTTPCCLETGRAEVRADSARRAGRPCGPDGLLFQRAVRIDSAA